LGLKVSLTDWFYTYQVAPENEVGFRFDPSSNFFSRQVDSENIAVLFLLTSKHLINDRLITTLGFKLNYCPTYFDFSQFRWGDEISSRLSLVHRVLVNRNKQVPIEVRLLYNSAFPFIILTFFLVGVFQMIFGFMKLGKYINYIPYPVVSGFATGIGLLIIIIQLKDLFDIDFDSHQAFNLIASINPTEMTSLEHGIFMAIAAILVIVFFPKVTKTIPAVLASLVVVSIIPYGLGWDNFSTVQMGESDQLSFKFEIFSTFQDMDGILRSIGYAFSLANISSINTLLTSLAADTLTAEKHNSDQELIGQGLGNLCVSLFGSMPGSGAVACTLTNIQYGGRTRLSGIICVAFLVLTWLTASDLIRLIPVSVLDGILIYVGYLIIDKKPLKHIKFLPYMDTFIMLIVIEFTTYGELLYAVVTGLSLASIYFMKKMADVVELDTKFNKVDRLVDHLIDSFEDASSFREKVYIKNIKEPVFFGLGTRFSESMEEISQCKAIIFNMSNVPYIDQSGLYTLEKEINKLKVREILICFSEVKKNIYGLLEKLELIPQLVDPEHIFPSVEENIIWLRGPGNLEGKVLHTLELDEEDVYIPEAFTPNDDGVNDAWEIKNIDRYPSCMVKVYTREGEQVYSSHGYEIP